jgi:hypothetical protein
MPAQALDSTSADVRISPSPSLQSPAGTDNPGTQTAVPKPDPTPSIQAPRDAFTSGG